MPQRRTKKKRETINKSFSFFFTLPVCSHVILGIFDSSEVDDNDDCVCVHVCGAVSVCLDSIVSWEGN